MNGEKDFYTKIVVSDFYIKCEVGIYVLGANEHKHIKYILQ